MKIKKGQFHIPQLKIRSFQIWMHIIFFLININDMIVLYLLTLIECKM